MTELSFLLELLMGHRLQKVTKELILQRIKEVETKLTTAPPPAPMQITRAISNVPIQAPSTEALLAKHGALPPSVVMEAMPIAQTPETAAAMEARQRTLSQAISGKPEPGRTSPRKF